MILTIIVVIVLTIFTQVGGVIYLLSFSLYPIINKKTSKYYWRVALKTATFFFLYIVLTLTFIPWLANLSGRVPLPYTQTNFVRPLNVMTCLLNRHYVRPELKQTTYEVAERMQKQFPGTVVNYLDGNFPFFNGFPLFPHLSHNDGKKLDVSFYYREKKTNKESNDSPSPIGYGVCEEPLPGEQNIPNQCEDKGYWQYSLLKKLIIQSGKDQLSFDPDRTAMLIQLFAAKRNINKIFIEPHLKKRLQLKSPKIRFHGCQAVRHNDHLHIQL